MMNKARNILNVIGKFLVNNSDYILFTTIIIFKLFLFATLSGTVFVKQGFLEYIAHFFHWLFTFNSDSLGELRQGVVMVSVGAVLLVSFWVFLLPKRGRIIALLSLDLVLSFVIFADMVYFRYFEDLISSAVLLQIGQVGALGDSISNLFSIVDWLFFIDLIIAIPLVIYFYKKIPKVKATTNKIIIRLANVILVFAIGFLFVFYPMKYFIDRGGSYLFEKTLSNMRVYEKSGLLGFHGFDIYKYVNTNVFQNNKLTTEEKTAIQDWFMEHQESQNTASEFTGIAKDSNVIILQLEAFENFLIDKKVDGQEITPNLNKLKNNSMYFNNFHHQTASGRTSDAEFLINTSFYPMYTGAAYISYSDNTFTAMPKILKENAYTTTAFHAYKKSFWNRYLMYPTLGIDTFYSLNTFEKDEPLGWSISDESMLRQTAEKLKTLKQPFHAQVVTLTSHHPYDIPEEYKELEIDSLKNTTFKNYLQSAHYVDKAVGSFIEDLKQAGLWENSVVVIYGDHDSALLEAEGEIAEFVGIENSPLGYQEYKKEVPLLIHLPNDQGAGLYEQVGGQIDIGPTVLDLLGVDSKDRYMMGTSLFQEEDRLVVFRQGSFTTNELFYDASIDGVFEKGVCYDRETGNEVALAMCLPIYDEALRQLQISDDVLRSDFIKELLNKEKK